MSQVVYDSISQYYTDLGSVQPTSEQRKTAETFASDPAVSSLVVHRDDTSVNGLRFDFTPGDDRSASGETLVFVKCAGGDGSNPDAIVNESQLIANLREKLEDSLGTGSGLLNILSMMHKYAKMETVMNAMKKDREELLPRVLEWAEECVTAERKDDKDLVDRISVYRAREGKIKAVGKVCDTLCGDIEAYGEAKKNLKQLAKEVGDEAQRLFREWCASCDKVSLDKRMQCIEIDASSQVPKVTFDPQLVKLSRDCRILRCLAFIIPEDIAEKEADVSRYGSVARELREIVNFYCTVGDQILLSQKPMLIDAAKAFTSLLESRDRISWDREPVKLRAWLDELREFARAFSSENKYLRHRHVIILQLLVPLFECSPGKWRLPLNEIRTMVHEVDARYTNTRPWKMHWDHQLYKLLEYHFNDALVRSDNWLGFGAVGPNASSSSDTYRVDLCFAAGRVAYRPSIEEIKAKIYMRIKKFLLTPVQFQGFVEVAPDDEPIFAAIYMRSFFSFPLLYTKAAEVIKELTSVAERFREWTALYHVIQSYGNSYATLSAFLKLETIDDYKNNLTLLKAKAQKFHKEFIENEIQCESANIAVNLLPIKTFVDWLLSEMDKLLVRTLKERTEAESRELSRECAEILERLGKHPNKISEFIELEQMLRKDLGESQSTWTAKYADINARTAFLKKWSANLAPNIVLLSNQFEELEAIFESKDSLLDSYKDIIKCKTESNVGNLAEEVNSVSMRWKKTSPSVRESKEFVADFKAEIEILMKEFEEADAACEYFNLEKPKSFAAFNAIVKEVLEIDAKINLINEFEGGISQYIEMEWIVSRNKLNTIEQYINKWEEENPKCGPILEGRIRDWRELVSVLRLCRGECFAKSHWTEFLAIIGLSRNVTAETLKLSHLLDKREILKNSKEALKELNAKAAGETSVRDTFNELDAFSATALLVLFDYATAEGQDIKLIKDWRAILNQIAESILTLQSLKTSEFFTNEFAERGLQWESRLTQLDSLINLLNSVQRKWTYLEPIYAKNQGPGVFTDYSFASASREFVETMKTIASDAHVVRLLRIPNLQARLTEMDSVLITCQKKLSVFMEESRNRFPRFYFLADDDLLLVLAGKVEISQAGLLKKLFNNNIVKLHFAEKSITAVESAEGEVVGLSDKVSTNTDQVETWLKALEVSVKTTLQKVLFEALDDGRGTLQNPSWGLPSQVLSLIQWTQFTARTEEAIKRSRLNDLKLEFGKQLSSLTSQKLDTDAYDTVLKIKVKSLVLDTIHFIAVVEELMESNIRTLDDWVWQKQLRYYATSKDRSLSVAMGTAKSNYSFEYLGCYGAAKLVHTPLTDKCYLTCMQAMSMGLGGNPYGPAGTGKTETVKALGQQLGRQVLVFNCDEAIDVKAMTRILVGLIKCGAWGCFDEFNRLNLDVLSALSSQIHSIQSCLKVSAKSVQLPEFGEVDVDHHSAVFITLNPLGKKYKGRNRLPDNLKALFLPVAMTVPDNVIISRVLLLAEGFDINLSNELGEKITSWFELAKNCMTQQNHYDWGLRAIKTCLNSSGRALRTSSSKDQIQVVVESLRKQIKSKLIADDELRFEALIQDVFGSNLSGDEDASSDSLKAAVVEIMKMNNLVADDVQVTKILELDEQLKSRLGVVILGESGVGKSSIWRTLIQARKMSTGQVIEPIVISPKSIPRSKLLGYIDEETREWQDGLLPSKAREVSRGEEGQYFWLIFDGDIDPEWVEALNSVLDDNKVLTLPSGERIDFDSDVVNLIFEVTSLKFASPATISRLGVISVGGIKSDHLIKTTLNQLNAEIPHDEISRNVSNTESHLKLSSTKTLLSHIGFGAANRKDASTSMSTYLRKSTKSVNPFKMGQLVVTPSIAQIIDFMSPWVDSNETVIVVGGKGVGKNAVLSETILKTGIVVPIFCCPETTPVEVIAKIRKVCTVMSSGASKIMKATTGGKLIVYARNLELLEPDKWQSSPVIAFLTSLLSHGGFYDDAAFEWTLLQNFQLVATCSSTDRLDARLLTLSHITSMSLPPSDEIKSIVELVCPDDAEWKSAFARSFTRVVQEMSRGTSSIDVLRSAVEIITSLTRCESVDGEVLNRETYRTLSKHGHEAPTALQGALMAAFGSADPEKLLRGTSCGSKITFVERPLFAEWTAKSITSFINETESFLPPIGLIEETIELFAEVTSFLSDASPGVQGTVLLGHSGSGRKLAFRVVSHVFGFDTVWSPRLKYSEKQLTAEFKTLFESAEGEGDKKILLILDAVCFELIPYLRKFVYTFMKEYSGEAIIRVVIVANELDATSDLMWSRVCQVRYVSEFSEKSLQLLPQMITDNIDEKFSANFPKVMRLFPQFENNGRRYLTFVNIHSKLLRDKKEDLESRRSHLQVGVAKLDEASGEVESLKTEAASQRQVLAAKRKEADEALTMITSSMEGAEDQKVELEDIKGRTEKETAKLKIRKREIDDELKLIEPTLLAAKAAVGGIKSEALSEIRSLRAPPEAIRDILEGVLRLMGVNDTSWVSMKSFLSRRGVKEEIINFDARRITSDMREKVEALLEARPNSFDEKTAKRASAAAAPLANWVLANLSFSRVLHKIKPLEDEQNRLESGLRSATTRMKSLSSQLEGVETHVGDLRGRLNQVTVEAAQIEVGLKQTTQVLAQSEALIKELSGEFGRWKQQLADLNAISNALPLNCLVSAAFVAFMGNMSSSERRRESIKDCCQLLNTEPLDVLAFLEVASEEEAFLKLDSPFMSLFVMDPAKKLASTLAKAEITDMSSRDWLRIVELGLRFGRTVLIDDFSRLELALLAVVRREVFGAEGSRFWTHLGDKRVDFNPAFKLYFLSGSSDAEQRLFNNSLFNVINLCPSGSSTAAALLSQVIEVRAPELEAMKLKLERERKAFDVKLRDLERLLLSKLISAHGNLLDDRQLIASLKEIKTSSKEVEAALQASAKVSADLDTQRAQYKSLADFASQLYFILNELAQLNRMYRFGIKEYEGLFVASLRTHPNLDQKQLLHIVYNYVSWALFPEEKTIFKKFCEARCPGEASALRVDETESLRGFFKELSAAQNRSKLVLIMTSPGSDPTAEIQEIAAELRIAQDMHFLSMGANVLMDAEKLVTNKKSHVCLSNLHLVVPWLTRLGKLLGDEEPASDRFIILVTECHDDFPTSLLEACLKFAYESPPGLQAHVNRLTFDASVRSSAELHALAYLHAVCCERRHFLPQGWTKAYEFGFVDFRSAIATINEVKEVKERRYQLDFIKGLLGTVIYGGKLDTKVDFNILQTIIRQWYSAEATNMKDMRASDEIKTLGLPANVRKWREALIDERIMKGLKVLEKATSTAQVREELRKLQTLWEQLGTSRRMAQRSGTRSGSRTPVSELVTSELSLARILVAAIEEDLAKKLRPEVQRALAANETPDAWLAMFESGPERADLFMRSVDVITKELQNLMSSGSAAHGSFQLGHFLHPAALLNALRQQASRELKVTIDWLKLCSAWGHQPRGQGQSASYTIEELIIEGATFEDGVLRETRVDSALQSHMPSLTAYFVTKDSTHLYDGETVALPLYASSARETLIAWLDVPCRPGSQELWTQRAAALVIR